MKKSMIAAAVAASMVAPAAMADTTLGGQLQAEVVSVSGDGPEGLYMTDGWEDSTADKGGASALFVKGAHDMGNGLKGVYKINLIPKFINNNASIGARDGYFGLSGGFGTVLFGRLNTPYKSSTVKWDPFLATFMQARGNNGMTAAGHNGYAGNVVAYVNKFGSAKVVAAVAFDECDDNPGNADNPDGDHAVTASVNVPVGPVELALAYIDTAGWNTFQDGVDNIEAIKAGVKFSSGAVTVAAQYETVDEGGNASLDNAFLTGSFKAGSNTFSASYGVAMPNSGDDGTYWAVGAKHAFSKQVTMLLGVTASDNADFDDAVADESMRVGLSTRIKF